MEVFIAVRAGFLLAAWPRRDVRFVTDHGVHIRLATFLIKLNRAVEVAVIRNRAGGHAEFLGLLDEGGNSIEAIEQAVVRVTMEVNERSGRHGRILDGIADVVVIGGEQQFRIRNADFGMRNKKPK